MILTKYLELKYFNTKTSKTKRSLVLPVFSSKFKIGDSNTVVIFLRKKKIFYNTSLAFSVGIGWARKKTPWDIFCKRRNYSKHGLTFT